MRGHEGAFGGDKHVRYLDRMPSLPASNHMHKLLKLYSVNVCSLLHANYTSTKSGKKDLEDIK